MRTTTVLSTTLLLAAVTSCGGSAESQLPDPCGLVNDAALEAAGVTDAESRESVEEDGEDFGDLQIDERAEEHATCGWLVSPEDGQLEEGASVRELTVVLERMADAEEATTVYEEWVRSAGGEEEELDLADQSVMWRYSQGPAVGLLLAGETVARVQLLALDSDGESVGPVEDEAALEAVRPAVESVGESL